MMGVTTKISKGDRDRGHDDLLFGLRQYLKDRVQDDLQEYLEEEVERLAAKWFPKRGDKVRLYKVLTPRIAWVIPLAGDKYEVRLLYRRGGRVLESETFFNLDAAVAFAKSKGVPWEYGW